MPHPGNSSSSFHGSQTCPGPRLDHKVFGLNTRAHSINGSLLTTWSDGQLLDAHGTYISPDDEIFLVDRDAHEVLKFSTEGRVLLRIGTLEVPSLHGPFNHPAAVAVAPSGEIFVADGYGNSRVHRFSAGGKLLNSWGAPGSGPGEFTKPQGFWVDPQERVYVWDRENNRVQIFDAEGEYRTEWRDFYHPMDIYPDPQGVFTWRTRYRVSPC